MIATPTTIRTDHLTKTSQVRVIHGANDHTFDRLTGKSVACVQESLSQMFNIPAEALAFLDGSEVGPGYRLRSSEVLEFVVRWGWKGAGNAWGRDRSHCDPNDFYPTPAYATWALLENEEFGTTVWEPACGDGAISRVLRAAGYRVISSDLVGRGYGQVEDFLTSRRRVESIVTNPPYKLAEEFVRLALRLSTHKVAMLVRLSFLESQGRYDLFQETPLKAVYVFSRRVSLYRGGISKKQGGVVAYAWCVWQHGFRGEPRLRWFSPDAGM
jgi:hypothetical protein